MLLVVCSLLVCREKILSTCTLTDFVDPGVFACTLAVLSAVTCTETASRTGKEVLSGDVAWRVSSAGDCVEAGRREPASSSINEESLPS